MDHQVKSSASSFEVKTMDEDHWKTIKWNIWRRLPREIWELIHFFMWRRDMNMINGEYKRVMKMSPYDYLYRRACSHHRTKDQVWYITYNHRKWHEFACTHYNCTFNQNRFLPICISGIALPLCPCKEFTHATYNRVLSRNYYYYNPDLTGECLLLTKDIKNTPDSSKPRKKRKPSGRQCASSPASIVEGR